MEPWKRTIPTIIVLLLGLISTNVHADITKTPTSGIFLEGSDVTLTCVVEGNDNVIWEDLSNATEIFVGKEKNTEKKKYDNFEISSGDDDFSLIIKDVQLSDEGTYICKDRDRFATAKVTIGVLPYVYLSVKQSEATQAPQTSTEVNITCSAYNARPAVSVFELSVIGSEKAMAVTNDTPNQNEDGKTYNSSVTVPFMVPSNDISVHCRVYTAGQSLNHTENFNLPICNITISGNEVRCTCQAHPKVDKYRMELNGNLKDGDILYLEESNSANITCFGTNGMGTGRSSILFPGNKAGFGIFSIVVTISVGVVLMVLAVIYIKHRLSSRRGKSDGNLDELGITESTPMNVSGPSTVSRNETSGSNKEVQTAVEQLSSRFFCDWEIFAVEDLNIEKEDVQTLSQSLTVTPNGVLVQDCVEAALYQWITINDAHDIQQLLTYTIISSKVCKDFLCNDCVSYFEEIPGYYIPENDLCIGITKE